MFPLESLLQQITKINFPPLFGLLNLKFSSNFLQLLTDKMSQSQRMEGKVSAFIDLSFIPKKNLAVGPRVQGVHYHGRYGVNILSVSVTSCQIRKRRKPLFFTLNCLLQPVATSFYFPKGIIKIILYLYTRVKEKPGRTYQNIPRKVPRCCIAVAVEL